MYTTCAFCNAALGGDGAETGLGVGKRFAYDGWKSRAWVICQRCARWNLTPYDNRIETIDALERIAAKGRTAATTEHVTLIRSGANDVVRIGRPGRPEMATWRYGERLKKRQREHLKVYVPVAALTVGAAITVDVLAGGSMAAMLGQLPAAIDWATMSIVGNQKVRIEPPLCERCGQIMVLKAKHLLHARLSETRHEDVGLLLSCPACRAEGALITGADAEQALRAGMTYVNLRRKRKVKKKAESAARYLDSHGGPETYLRDTVRRERKIGQLAGEEALALEMAVDEHAELQELEREWRQAEEIASIADNLLSPPSPPSPPSPLINQMVDPG